MMAGLLDPSTGIFPEPPNDMAAQAAALADPDSAKDALFVAPGSPDPGPLPGERIERPDGTLVTTNPGKAQRFRQAPALTDELMSGLLDYPESKREALTAGGVPVVVQNVAWGGIAHEGLSSPRRLPAAIEAARAAAPGGAVRVTTPQAAVAARLHSLLAQLRGP